MPFLLFLNASKTATETVNAMNSGKIIDDGNSGMVGVGEGDGVDVGVGVAVGVEVGARVAVGVEVGAGVGVGVSANVAVIVPVPLIVAVAEAELALLKVIDPVLDDQEENE